MAASPAPHPKHARIEFERRFLLDRFPEDVRVQAIRHIHDRYIDGTTLRLREQTDHNGPAMFKLTQKISARAAGSQQGFITSMYLSEGEFRLLAQLSGKELCKTRYSVPPFGIDVFEGRLQGLILAEAEFDSAAGAAGLALPAFLGREVSEDDRFTGGRLVDASRDDLQRWLSEYGIRLEPA